MISVYLLVMIHLEVITGAGYQSLRLFRPLTSLFSGFDHSLISPFARRVVKARTKK